MPGLRVRRSLGWDLITHAQAFGPLCHPGLIILDLLSLSGQAYLCLLPLGLPWKCQGPMGLRAGLLWDPLGPRPALDSPPRPTLLLLSAGSPPNKQLRAMQLLGPRAPQGSWGQLLVHDPADPCPRALLPESLGICPEPGGAPQSPISPAGSRGSQILPGSEHFSLRERTEGLQG